MNDLTPIDPTMPPAPYLGGKSKLAKTIIAKINKTPHSGYAEPFVGMGGIFFRRDKQPKTEVINDISGDVANLFRILQRHYPQFMDTLKYQLTSRKEFMRLTKTDPSTLTDLERAARFIYLQKTAFGGKPSGQNFGVDKTGTARFNLTKVVPILEDVHGRLSGVIIESLPYADFIKRYDRDGMLFYLDPPYWGGEADYGKGIFAREDFQTIADTLSNIKGRFILSINDRPEIREIYSKFDIEEVKLTYSIAGGKGTKANELIISSGH